MGWDYGPETKAQLIERITRQYNSNHGIYLEHVTCIAHTITRGNILWSVWERTLAIDSTTTRFIGCDLLKGSGNYWGHKSMCESEYPYYYSCPLGYLDMVPEGRKDWREAVREYHAKHKTV